MADALRSAELAPNNGAILDTVAFVKCARGDDEGGNDYYQRSCAAGAQRACDKSCAKQRQKKEPTGANTQSTKSAPATVSTPEPDPSAQKAPAESKQTAPQRRKANQPRIAMWCGKVNQHFADGKWMTDADGSSGCHVDKLEYCRKFWPSTVSVEEAGKEMLDGFMTSGNRSGPYRLNPMTYECVLKPQAP